MDYKNLKQFIPGYHSITGYETIRIKASIGDTEYTRYCQAFDDPCSDKAEKTFVLADTKRVFDRWRFPLAAGATIQDYNGTYKVTTIEYSPTSGRNLHSLDSGIVICRTKLIDDNGLSESDYIFGILHQMDLKDVENLSDKLAVSGRMKSSGKPSLKEFQIISLPLPQSSSFSKAFIVLTPNSEIKRKNFLIGTYSKIDEHGDQYQVCEVDQALHPTYPFLLATECDAIA